MPIAAVVYDAPRVITGLAVAVALLAVAVWLVRVTEWSSPNGYETPEEASSMPRSGG